MQYMYCHSTRDSSTARHMQCTYCTLTIFNKPTHCIHALQVFNPGSMLFLLLLTDMLQLVDSPLVLVSQLLENVDAILK